MWRLQFAQPTDPQPCFAQPRYAWLWPTRKASRNERRGGGDVIVHQVTGVRSERLPYEGIFATTTTRHSSSTGEADVRAMRSTGATVVSVAAAPSTPPSIVSTAHDTCLLSHETLSFDLGAASRLRAVSVDGSRILVREAVVGGEGEEGSLIERANTSCSCHLTRRRATAPVYDVDDDNEEEQARRGAASSPPHAMQMAQWRLRGSALLAAVDAEPLQRVRRYDRSALSVTALSASTLFLLDLEGGVDGPRVVQTSSCQDCVMSNLTCLDYWSPHAIVVGSSDGTVRLYDWRVGGEEAAMVAAVTVQVPLLHTGAVGRRRGQRVAQGSRVSMPAASATRVGVLSCCALEQSYRVVCGLVDPHHSLAITDLRRPCAAPRKRGSYTTPLTRAHALLAGLACSPTGRPVTDLRHCPSVFGRLGLVDSAGRALVSSIVDLERGTCGGFEENGCASVDDNTQAASLAATCAGSGGALLRNRASRPPDLLDPAHVALRLGHRGLFPPNPQQRAMPTSVAQHSGSGASPPVSLQLRCDFARDGAALVHTQPGALCACVTSEAGALHELRVTGGASVHSFVSVSCMDRLVCLDTTHGDSLCFTLSP